MNENNTSNYAKDFLVSTADFAFYVDNTLACTGTTNLNASLQVSMEEHDVNAGKGNKVVYSFKYGRQLSVTLEAADWKLEYLALASGSKITEGMTDVYKLGEGIVLKNGTGTLSSAPIGDVAAELPDGRIVTVTPDGMNIDLSAYGMTGENDSVKATYRYSRNAKSITIDAETNPMSGRLVLDADKHNNKLGKVGSVQIIIPSYQLNGNFNLEITPDGVASTSLEGKALAVDGDTCADGFVYAYIKEFNDKENAVTVQEIAATPSEMHLDTADNTMDTISVIGLKGTLYAPVELDNSTCTFTSDTPGVASVNEDGIVTAAESGSAKITVDYNGVTDDITVIVA